MLVEIEVFWLVSKESVKFLSGVDPHSVLYRIVLTFNSIQRNFICMIHRTYAHMHIAKAQGDSLTFVTGVIMYIFGV